MRHMALKRSSKPRSSELAGGHLRSLRTRVVDKGLRERAVKLNCEPVTPNFGRIAAVFLDADDPCGGSAKLCPDVNGHVDLVTDVEATGRHDEQTAPACVSRYSAAPGLRLRT